MKRRPKKIKLHYTWKASKKHYLKMCELMQEVSKAAELIADSLRQIKFKKAEQG